MRVRCLFVAVVIATFIGPLAGQTAHLKVLHDFGSSQDGNHPAGPLVIDRKGTLYGVTGGGPGLYGYGVAFKLVPLKNGNWAEATVHTFLGGSDGAFPWGSLTLDTSGNLYGTLQGDFGGDVSGIFELSRGSSGWANTILSTENAGPGLVSDSLGNLFGGIGPGQSHLGAVGELSPGSGGWNYTQLYSFCPQNGCPDGFDPLSPPSSTLRAICGAQLGKAGLAGRSVLTMSLAAE